MKWFMKKYNRKMEYRSISTSSPDPRSLIPDPFSPGFTLIEMLIVIGIIAILTGTGMATYSGVVAKAQNAKCQELVHNAATALVKTLQDEGCWPNRILSEGGGSGKMTAEVGGELARRKALSLNYRAEKNEETGETVYKLVGLDQCGVVSPWAAEVVRRKAASGSVSLDEEVPTGGKIRDHVLRFAVDDNEDGLEDVKYESGDSVTVRSSAAVWCCGRDGVFGTKDDIVSWSRGQVK